MVVYSAKNLTAFVVCNSRTLHGQGCPLIGVEDMICADSIRVVHPLFQAEGGGSIPTSALQLQVVKIEFKVAKSLNRLWHSRLPFFREPNMGWLCFGAEFEGIIYAVSIWSHPVARLLPQVEWFELRRLAIAPDAPRNTASRMLAVMARLIRKAKPEVTRLISYQDTQAHTGAIYKAAGWQVGATSDGDGWDRPNRSRPAAQSLAPKVRWEKVL